MAECYFSQPEDLEARKVWKEIKREDVFPAINPYQCQTDQMFPDNVTRLVHQLKSQENLKKSADLLNEHLRQLQLQKEYELSQMTDDQRRVAKIKERMLKRKANQVR